jgi:hypothetical protein
MRFYLSAEELGKTKDFGMPIASAHARLGLQPDCGFHQQRI